MLTEKLGYASALPVMMKWRGNRTESHRRNGRRCNLRRASVGASPSGEVGEDLDVRQRTEALGFGMEILIAPQVHCP